MAQFGKVSVNSDLDWSNWTWTEFLDFYDHSLKGKATETPEEIAGVLGVKLPDKPKKKAENAE